MKTVLPTLVGIPLLALLGVGLADRTDAASSKQRGYTQHCYGTPEQCMRMHGYRATPPTTGQAPRGYLPPQPQRYGREYDFPRFGTQRWWEQQEDRD